MYGVSGKTKYFKVMNTDPGSLHELDGVLQRA